MKTTLLCIVLFFLFSNFTFAQNIYSVKGSVIDTVSNIKLTNTSVSVLRSKDSTLIQFTRADENGLFAIDHLPKGKLFLLVTYPGYADYLEPFQLDSIKSKIDFGRIKLTLTARLLQDVIIKGKAVAIKIKGDTTEFNASAYQVPPNAKVEDLLKQLPGIQVDKDGKITAQGQKVNKVLVDGEEFFGDDPTLVTKNLRADMVDKVQLYDKKSDQAAFTGIDDDKKSKTINIKLKDDKKNGYFGKLELAAATDKYYEEQGMFNIFKGKQKFSAYGTLSNTGKIGLGWQDDSKYGSSDNVEFGDGYISINDDGKDALSSFNGRYDGQGFPIARTGGLHYDTKWNNDKESINTNYKIGSLNVEGNRTTDNQNNLPTGILKTNSNENFDNFMFRQKADVTYQVKLDSTSNIKVSVDGMARNSEANSDFTTTSLRNDSLINSTKRSVSNNIHDKVFNAKLLWTKKLKKTGRTLSVNLAEAYNQSESKGFLKSDNTFYGRTGTVDSTQVVDQYKTSTVNSSNFNTNIAYTEPLSKTLTLALNYGIGIGNSHSDRKSFNPSSSGNYDILDQVYSNDYQIDQFSNQGGAIFNYKKDKTTVNFGSKVTNVNFDQKNLYDNSDFKRNFVNWKPEASYRYKFSQQKSISINYNGSTTQPTIDQIQPIAVNTDPLNIILGNPDLKPSFRNSVSLYYNSYKVLTGQYIYLGGSYNVTSSAIVSNTFTDAAGKTTFQSTNLEGKNTTDFNTYFYTERKINFLDINVGFEGGAYGNTYYNYVNNVLNKTRSNSYNGSLNLSRYAEKKYTIRLSGGPTYKTSQSSLQASVNDNGWGYKASYYLAVFLPLKFEITTDGDYEFRGKTASFNSDFSRMIMNAKISKKFLKSEGLKFSLGGNDLLDQNKGFSRTASGTSITQSNYSTIRRYYSASLSWDFSKMGGSTAKK